MHGSAGRGWSLLLQINVGRRGRGHVRHWRADDPLPEQSSRRACAASRGADGHAAGAGSGRSVAIGLDLGGETRRRLHRGVSIPQARARRVRARAMQARSMRARARARASVRGSSRASSPGIAHPHWQLTTGNSPSQLSPLPSPPLHFGNKYVTMNWRPIPGRRRGSRRSSGCRRRWRRLMAELEQLRGHQVERDGPLAGVPVVGGFGVEVSVNAVLVV